MSQAPAKPNAMLHRRREGACQRQRSLRAMRHVFKQEFGVWVQGLGFGDSALFQGDLRRRILYRENCDYRGLVIQASYLGGLAMERADWMKH